MISFRQTIQMVLSFNHSLIKTHVFNRSVTPKNVIWSAHLLVISLYKDAHFQPAKMELDFPSGDLTQFGPSIAGPWLGSLDFFLLVWIHLDENFIWILDDNWTIWLYHSRIQWIVFDSWSDMISDAFTILHSNLPGILPFPCNQFWWHIYHYLPAWLHNLGGRPGYLIFCQHGWCGHGGSELLA